MERAHEVESIRFSGSVMTLKVDGRQLEVDLEEVSAALAGASSAKRENFVVSPSGYGIHWPELDEDLSIDGLMGIRHTPPKLQAAG